LVHNTCGPDTAPNLLYRSGKTNPGNLTPRPNDDGLLSFRNSLSYPIDPTQPGPLNGTPVFPSGKPYFAINADGLPAGSSLPDDIPPGHVSIMAGTPYTPIPAATFKDVVVETGQIPK